MILFDRPRPVVFRGFRWTAHLMSTLRAPDSTDEILDFGVRIGLREEWLQYRGEWKEHFDLFDEAILRARNAGALEVARRRLAELNERRALEKRARFGPHPSRHGTSPAGLPGLQRERATTRSRPCAFAS